MTMLYCVIFNLRISYVFTNTTTFLTISHRRASWKEIPCKK